MIVDEAHGFRTDTTGRYDDLQRICKTQFGVASRYVENLSKAQSLQKIKKQ